MVDEERVKLETHLHKQTKRELESNLKLLRSGFEKVEKKDKTVE